MISTLHTHTIGRGIPLVLIHGWGWHSGIWQPLVERLSQKFQLILVDLPGFGESSFNQGAYTFDAIAQQIVSVVPDNAVWLGWSLGGMLVWWIAIHHPQKVKKLITVASTPRFIQDDNWPGVELTLLLKFANSLMQQTEQTLLDFLALQIRGSANNEKLFLDLQKQLLQTNLPNPAALQGGLSLLRDTDLRSQLSKITVPSLHLFGRMDRLVPSAVAQLLSPLLTHGKIEVFSHAGHIPFLSQQEQFINALYHFI